MRKANSKLSCCIGLLFILIGLRAFFIEEPILAVLTLLSGILLVPQIRLFLHRNKTYLKRWLGIGIPMLFLITSAGCGSQVDSKSVSDTASDVIVESSTLDVTSE